MRAEALGANGSPGTRALKLSAGPPWLSGLDWVSFSLSEGRKDTEGTEVQGPDQESGEGPGRSGQTLRGPEGDKG